MSQRASSFISVFSFLIAILISIPLYLVDMANTAHGQGVIKDAITRAIVIKPKRQALKTPIGYKSNQALLIGVSDYDQRKSEGTWLDLRSIPKELDKLQATLTDLGFQVTRVNNPDHKQLKAAFEDFIDAHGYEDNSRLLFYFSGHGHSMGEPGDERGFLVPANAPDPNTDKKGFLRTALPMSQILAWSRQMTAKHSLFLFDSCFSGTVFTSKSLPKVPPHITQMTAKPVRQFISAGSAGQEIPSVSVFADCVVQGLKGEADLDKDEFVLGTELGIYLQKRLAYYQTGQTPQHGKIRDHRLDKGEFVIRIPKKQKPSFDLNAAAGSGKIPDLTEDKTAAEKVRVASAKQDADKLYLQAHDLKEVGKYSEASVLFRQAAELGKKEAMTHLGMLLKKGQGIPVNVPEAFKWFKKSAELGEAYAMNNLATHYEEGAGVTKDLSQAFYWYKKSAELGVRSGMASTGYAYQYGRGTVKDLKQSAYWYEQAANKGDAISASNLAIQYRKGQGVKQDLDRARLLFKKSADLGDAFSMNEMGKIYEEGIGVKVDYVQARAWYLKGAEKGSTNAMNHLGVMYETGRGVKVDMKEASKWYQQAADGGHKIAMSNLGIHYHYGRSGPIDFKRAAYWYGKAAELKDSYGIYSMGLLYKQGLGVEKDEKKALAYFREAAELKDGLAMIQLGIIYKYGRGVTQNDRQAVIWYERAIEAGQHGRAYNNLAVMYLDGRGVKKNVQTAIKYFQEAVKRGDDVAAFNLATRYEGGHGVPMDLDKATELYKLSFDRGYAPAKKEFDRLSQGAKWRVK